MGRKKSLSVIYTLIRQVGIVPGAEQHSVDEEDLPITSTCDNPHTVTLHTEPLFTDTAAQNRQSSPSVRDD